MDQITWDEEQIFSRLAAGAVVLSVNNRLARWLTTRYDEQMKAAGMTVWATPSLMPVTVWLESSLAVLGEDWRLLNDRQAVQLWERIISAESANNLLQLSTTAKMAYDACQLAEEYQLDFTAQQLNEDQHTWLRWRKSYTRSLQNENWHDRSAAWQRVLAAIGAGQMVLPNELLLLGFDELSPYLLRLSEVGAAAGCRVQAMPPRCAPQGQLWRVPCVDVDDEVRTAARWTRQLLDDGATNIGIVVPNLQSSRTQIERIFRAELDPPSLLTPAHDPHGFNLSLGRPLAEQGVIAAALEILQLERELPIENISRLLRSPYFNRGHELTNRAQLDGNLRGLRRARFSFAAVVRLAEKNQGRWRYSHAPELARRGKDLLNFIATRERHLPGDWINPLLHALDQAGWPGSRGFDSSEYQALSAWRDKLLPSLAALDIVSEPLDRHGVVALLRRLAQETLFQPEGSSGSVQVLGLLEAAGLHFDHLWVMGMTDSALPEAARPNPFLPVQLQCRFHLPHADPEHELVFARQITQRLFAAAPQVMLSHPQREGSLELRPSPLIASLPEHAPQLAASHDPAMLFFANQSQLDSFLDEQGAALPAGQRTFGGTAILKDQALCPFRAYARHRLYAHDFERPEIGLDALQRGSLVHACLEEVWRQLGDSASLHSMSEAAIDTLVVAAVAVGVQNELAHMPEKPGARLLEVECRRLEKLLGRWLREVERPRPEFQVVAVEQAHSEQVGALAFQVKVDRIDRLADGRKFIIDYKTGQVRVADLIGDRLLEPQLPIYALNVPPHELAGIAFGILRGDDLRFVGIAAHSDLVPGVSGVEKSRIATDQGLGDWRALTAAWRIRLEALAADFCSGAAAVAPVSAAQACRYCDLSGFCRIDEQGGGSFEEEV